MFAQKVNNNNFEKCIIVLLHKFRFDVMAQKRRLDSANGSSPSKRVCPTVGDEIELSKISEVQPKATIHGVVVGLSPLKDNRAATLKWFDGEIADSESVVHFVSFDSRLWQAMDKSREEKSAIALRNCSIQRSRRTLDFEIVANDRTKVVSSPRKFQLDGTVDRHASIKVLSISEACKLSPGSLVSMMVKIQSVDAPVEILRSDKQTHVTKQDCNIADATGSCRLVLWADRVGTLKEGRSYHLKSVAVRQYKNQKYMSVLEHTTDMENIDDIGAVDVRCATTDKTIVGEISSVLSFERYLSCPECKSKVHEVDDVCGQCTKCGGAMKLSKCPKNMLAKVKVEDNECKTHFGTMFTNTILSIIKTDEGNVSRKLLQTSEMLFTISNRDIITCVTNPEEPSTEHAGESDVSAATIGNDDNHAKTWREDPGVLV